MFLIYFRAMFSAIFSAIFESRMFTRVSTLVFKVSVENVFVRKCLCEKCICVLRVFCGLIDVRCLCTAVWCRGSEI